VSKSANVHYKAEPMWGPKPDDMTVRAGLRRKSTDCESGNGDRESRGAREQRCAHAEHCGKGGDCDAREAAQKNQRDRSGGANEPRDGKHSDTDHKSDEGQGNVNQCDGEPEEPASEPGTHQRGRDTGGESRKLERRDSPRRRSRLPTRPNDPRKAEGHQDIECEPRQRERVHRRIPITRSRWVKLTTARGKASWHSGGVEERLATGTARLIWS
jgi:hypothetical protein